MKLIVLFAIWRTRLKRQDCLKGNRRASIQLILSFVLVNLSTKLTLKSLEQVLNINIIQRGETFEAIESSHKIKLRQSFHMSRNQKIKKLTNKYENVGNVEEKISEYMEVLKR
jgi:hypothetical protein